VWRPWASSTGASSTSSARNVQTEGFKAPP